MFQVLGVIIIVHVLGIGFGVLGGQNLRPIIGYHQGVFVLAGPAAISGLRQPTTLVSASQVPVLIIGSTVMVIPFFKRRP